MNDATMNEIKLLNNNTLENFETLNV